MEGYIQSRLTTYMHIFKMSVRPGEKIALDILYSLYGKKHGIKEEEFVQWIKDVKLKGQADNWNIVEGSTDYSTEPEAKEAPKKNFDTNNKGEVVANKMGVEDVIGLSVRKARDIVPTIMDVKLLKYALVEAKPRANKESLCRILEKRINELGLHL